ncbi:MAG: dihydrodipicolinate synthase family protein [Candidatus Bathyarchaeia archaeon]
MSGKLSGVMALPPTPLSKDGRVDADGLISLIDFELANGCDGIGVLAAWARGYLMSDKDGET